MTRPGLRIGFASLRDRLRTQLWPVPTAGIALGLALGIALPRLDAGLGDGFAPIAGTYVFGGGPSAARTVLGTIASSLITVTALTFTLTVVTLQLASSQFSPRLLRTFTRDRFVHVTLALFLATFTFALVVLRTVRDARASQRAFVPQLSITLALALALVSVLGLVLFLAHLAQQIRVETMLGNVHRDAEEAVRRILRGADGGSVTEQSVLVPPAHATVLRACSSGFLVEIDRHELLTAAVDADAFVLVDCHPGSSVVSGTPVGVCWARDTASPSAMLDELPARAAHALRTGVERTQLEDLGFGVRQLADVATKALSPGINDPTTAVHALGHCSALLCELAQHDLGPQLLRDENDECRVSVRQLEFCELLEIAIAQPRRYGASDPSVLGRLFMLLAEVGWHVQHGAQRDPLMDQLCRLRAIVARQDFDATELRRLNALAILARAALEGQWHSRPREA